MVSRVGTGPRGCLVVSESRPHAAVRLFCLPYAGGGAGVYRDWPGAFAPDVEVVAVRLPGRESRFAERAMIDVDDLAYAIAGHGDLPYALYGHSMGARLGFEIVRTLRRAGGTGPLRLYVGGCRPPDAARTGPLEGISGLDDEALTDVLVAHGGLPEEIARDRDLLDLVLPTLRADLTWCDRYRYRPEAAITTPIVAFTGQRDGGVSPDDISGWRRHTACGFVQHTLAGGHFFVHENLPELAALITSNLLPAQTGPQD